MKRGTMAGEQFNTGYYRVTRHQGRKISPSFPEITHSTRGVFRTGISILGPREVWATPLDSSDLIP